MVPLALPVEKNFLTTMKNKQIYTSPSLLVEEVELNQGIAISDGVDATLEIFTEEDYTWIL